MWEKHTNDRVTYQDSGMVSNMCIKQRWSRRVGIVKMGHFIKGIDINCDDHFCIPSCSGTVKE